MSEAIVDFKEVSNLLAPAFKDRLVRVVWDEYKSSHRYDLMNEQAMDYKTAHNIAEQAHNYSRFLNELDEREGLK